MGKFAAMALILSAVFAGVGIWYFNTTAYWAEVADAPDMTLLPLGEGAAPEAIGAMEMRVIASESSPLGYRACFAVDASLAMLTETYVMHGAAAPTVAPSWFDCFDAGALGAELTAGTALAFIGQKNVGYGVDLIVAVTQDGRGYAWRELNNCGKKAYDGSVVGEDCPDRASFEGLK